MGESEPPSERAPLVARPKKPTPVERRREIEARISTGLGVLGDASRLEIDDELDSVLDALFSRFRRSWLESTKLEVAVEIARVLEIRLTMLRNYTVDPTSDARSLATGIRAIFSEAGAEKLALNQEALSFYRAVLAIYAGDPLQGLTDLANVFESKSGEGLDAIRYQAHMIAAHLLHETSEFAAARSHAERAAELATGVNSSAQALAVAGVNSFALGERDRSMRELEDALRYFDEGEPLFNPYFFRNTLLMCGLICFVRRDDDAAESFCRRALEHTEPSTYDAFEAWSRLGRVLYRQGRVEEAADAFEKGIVAYRHGESEILLDVCLWLARASLDRGRTDRARSLLLRIVASEVDYSSKDDARHLLSQMQPA
jgi:tetratricopeptide (TPR) repeat protein